MVCRCQCANLLFICMCVGVLSLCVSPGHRYLTGASPGRGHSHGRIQRAEGTGVSVCRSIYSSGEMVGFTLPR